MGDTGEAFKAFQEIKREERSKKEPERFEYAHFHLEKLGLRFQIVGDYFLIWVGDNTITFYPFTGWFQGQRPLGYIRGRGIHKLTKELGKLKGEMKIETISGGIKKWKK